eukprot:6190276-Pleurochrysis_carterae.AAC.1
MVNGDAGKREAQGVELPHGEESRRHETHGTVGPQEIGRMQSETRPRSVRRAGHKPHADSGINCAIQDKQCAIGIDDAIMLARRKADHACRTECVIQTFGQECTASSREHLQGTMGTKGSATMWIVHTLICMYWIGLTWLKHGKKQSTSSEDVEKEHAKKRRETKAKNKARERIRRRRLIQQRIREWNKARKGRYDGKDRMKYRQKVRASKRWLRRANSTEAKEVNNRGVGKCGRKKREKDMKRRGGSGGRGGARAVNASEIEEGLMKDIGVPRHTWGDGSCWLWA